MNGFIVDDVHVWDENPSPRKEEFIKDYRKIRVPDNLTYKDFNFYLTYQAE